MRILVLDILVMSFLFITNTLAQNTSGYNFPNNDENVYSFDLEGNTLIYSNGKNITFYDLKKKELVNSLVLPTEKKVMVIQKDTDNDLVYIGTEVGELLAIEISTGEVKFQFAYVNASVTTIVINSTGTLLFVGLSNGMVYKYDIQNLNNHSEFYQHGGGITSIKMSPKNHIIAISSSDGTISLHNDVTLEYINTLTVGKGWIRDVVFNTEKSIFACVGDDGKLHQWNMKNIESIHSMNTSKESGNWLLSIDAYRDGNAYCFGGVNGSLAVLHRFGRLSKKFKGPVLKSRFVDDENNELRMVVCVLGSGVYYVHAKDMKFNAL